MFELRTIYLFFMWINTVRPETCLKKVNRVIDGFMLTSRDNFDDNKVIMEQNFCGNTVISAILCRLVTKLLTGMKKKNNEQNDQRCVPGNQRERELVRYIYQIINVINSGLHIIKIETQLLA